MKTKLTRRELVHQYLVNAPEGKWINGHVLCRPSIGGSEGLRRLRELREQGVDIELRSHPTKGRSTVQYRLKP